MFELHHGDCLEIMKKIPDKSIDLVLTDPPYGTTANKWDSVIPFDLMWKELNRICKDDSAVLLFGSEPFSSLLRVSNLNNFKYDWIWNKNKFANQMLAKYQPMKIHEIVSVFSKETHNYYPQGLIKFDQETKQGKKITDNNGGGSRESSYNQEYTNYPKSIVKYDGEVKTVHPTQKPTDLLEYLIKTYSKEKELVLDFTMGSGSTGVAAKKLKRNFIGIEKDDKYFEIAKKRIENGESCYQADLF